MRKFALGRTACAVTEDALARQDVDLPFVSSTVRSIAGRPVATYLTGAVR